MLEVRGLHVSYGSIPAVRGVDLDAGTGRAVAVVGRNGAGKTSTMRALAGLTPVAGGRIAYDGKDVTHVPAEQRVAAGISLAPEGRAIFPGLTVRDNLLMGGYHRRLRRSGAASEIERVCQRFPRLSERLGQPAGSLSGGEQQMLAVARALMSAPKVLLIDEPSLGLAPLVVEQLYELLSELRDEGLTIVVVEQYVEFALEFAHWAYVLDKGRVVLDGPSADLARNPELIAAYMAAAEPEGAPA